MPDGKSVRPPSDMAWVNKSQLQAMTRMSSRTIKGVLEQSDIKPKQANAKSLLYPTSQALELLYKAKYGLGGGDGNGDVLDERRAKTQLAKNQAEGHRIKNEISIRNLIPVDDLEMHWCDIVSKVRAKLLSLPSILATQCVGIDSIKQIKDEATSIVENALDELSVDLLPILDENTLDESDTENTSSSSEDVQATT